MYYLMPASSPPAAIGDGAPPSQRQLTIGCLIELPRTKYRTFGVHQQHQHVALSSINEPAFRLGAQRRASLAFGEFVLAQDEAPCANQRVHELEDRTFRGVVQWRLY